MTTEIDVSGYDMAETLQKDRRRRQEAALCDDMSDLDTLLLPLALAIARMSARAQIAEAHTSFNKKDQF